MTLEGRKYISQYSDKKLSKDLGNFIDLSSNVHVSGITIELGYWRKANAIHNWFIYNCANGVDDCTPVYVPEAALVALKENCERALIAKSKEEREKILPTASGFFFGNTEYEEYYEESLKETIEILSNALNLGTTHDLAFYYSASW